MIIRALTPDDAEAIHSVIKNRGRYDGVQADKFEVHAQLSYLSLVDLTANPSQGTLYGAFLDNVLQGFLVTILSDQQPCYFVRRAQTIIEARLDTLSKLFAAAVKDHEERGFSRFYTLYRKDVIGLYHRLWRTTEGLKNYISYTDLEIPPNTRPKHQEVWEALCGRTLTPDVTVVRGFIRKSDSLFLNEERL